MSEPESEGCSSGPGVHAKIHSATAHARVPPNICAAMKGPASAGAIPAKVSDSARAIVTAGLANDVLAVNQYAAAGRHPHAKAHQSRDLLTGQIRVWWTGVVTLPC